MSRIIMCLDCPEYQTGGYCRHKHKDVGALQPACDHALKMNEMFNPEGDDAPLTSVAQPAPAPAPAPKPEQEGTKTCPRCGRELPRSAFQPKLEAKDGLQSWCKECHREYDKTRAEKRKAERQTKRPLPDKIEGKRCPHCGRDLPLSEYYLKDGKPAWICKECTKAYNVQKAKERRDAKSAQENAGATTKVCKACGRELLLLDAFGAHAKTWDHKATVCKECMVEKLTKNKAPKPTPAPVIDEGIRTVKAAPVDEPILLADIDTSASLENFESKRLVEELRARGYTVTCSRPITVIEEL